MVMLLTIILLFGITISILHIIGLILLTNSFDRNINGTQKFLIFCLSLTEISLSIVSIIRQSIVHASGSRRDTVSSCIQAYYLIVNENMYYLIMFLITLDRYLEIRLNIKYGSCWTKNRAKNILLAVFVTVNAAYAVLLYIFLVYRQSTLPSTVVKSSSNYYVPVIAFLFIIFATTTYSYIFSKIHKNRRKDEALRRQVKLDEPVNFYKVNEYGVPFWIIATFYYIQSNSRYCIHKYIF